MINDTQLDKMSLEEKIAYCSGKDYWHTKEMLEGEIPSMMMCDGPHGLRKQENTSDMLGINRSVPATCFPTAVTTACSFDVDLLAKMGNAIAKEAADNEVGLLLGPGANIKRNPLCGRNFEYFSEDPYLTGQLAAGFIKGVESTGVSACLKHFAFNSQEYKRFLSDSVMDERTMREIYLAGFEMAVKEGKPSSVMCAYNKINGEHCSDSKMLLTDILRNEWGFDGAVVTDWGAMSDRIKGFEAGCDLSMPGGSAYMEEETVKRVKNGELDEKYIDSSVKRISHLVDKGIDAIKSADHVDMEEHYQLARQIAVESAVLLKNNDNILPIASQGEVVIIGHMAREIRYQGTGSSHINPWKLTSLCDAYHGFRYVEGCNIDGETNDEMLNEAIKEAKNAKIAIIIAGLTDKGESEGFDRKNMKMPEGHIKLIEEVAKVNSNTVVVLLSGSPLELPWEDNDEIKDNVKAILYMGLSGEAGGDAIADILFGRVVPCGKLAESWPKVYEDCVSSSYFIKEMMDKDAHYREGLYVGYRYYTSANVPVRYPFGYGLSYAEFEYSDITIDIESNKVRCIITNKSNMPAKEIVQLYIKPPKGKYYRPIRELKGFKKVKINPNESKTVEFELNDRSFAIWDNGWIIPEGVYEIQVGSSSEDIRLRKCINKENLDYNNIAEIPKWYFEPKGIPSHEDFEQLVGHSVVEKDVKKGEFTMANSVSEMKKYSLVMKMVYKIADIVVTIGLGGKKDKTDSSYRMMMNTAVDSSLCGLKICTGMKNNLFEGLVEIANGHIWRGIKMMFRKDKFRY